MSTNLVTWFNLRVWIIISLPPNQGTKTPMNESNSITKIYISSCLPPTLRSSHIYSQNVKHSTHSLLKYCPRRRWITRRYCFIHISELKFSLEILVVLVWSTSTNLVTWFNPRVWMSTKIPSQLKNNWRIPSMSVTKNYIYTYACIPPPEGVRTYRAKKWNTCFDSQFTGERELSLTSVPLIHPTSKLDFLQVCCRFIGLD